MQINNIQLNNVLNPHTCRVLHYTLNHIIDITEDNELFEDFSSEICDNTIMAPPTTLDAPLRETQSTATSGGSSTPTSGVSIPTSGVSTPTSGVSTPTSRVSTPTLGVNMATVNSDVLVEGFQSPDLPACEKFVRDTCGCSKADDKPCSSLFSMEHYLDLRAQASLLTHDELDLVLMGSVMSTILTDDVAWCRHKPTKRSRIRQHYMHNGHTICKTTFMFLYGIGKKRLLAVKDAYNNNGLETRIHKNRKSLPHNYRSYDVIKNFVTFLQNYCEENAILLPGRIPGYKRDDIKILPSSQSKKVQ